jgi:hypothetical protein
MLASSSESASDYPQATKILSNPIHCRGRGPVARARSFTGQITGRFLLPRCLPAGVSV